MTRSAMIRAALTLPYPALLAIAALSGAALAILT